MSNSSYYLSCLENNFKYMHEYTSVTRPFFSTSNREEKTVACLQGFATRMTAIQSLFSSLTKGLFFSLLSSYELNKAVIRERGFFSWTSVKANCLFMKIFLISVFYPLLCFIWPRLFEAVEGHQSLLNNIARLLAMIPRELPFAHSLERKIPCWRREFAEGLEWYCNSSLTVHTKEHPFPGFDYQQKAFSTPIRYVLLSQLDPAEVFQKFPVGKEIVPKRMFFPSSALRLTVNALTSNQGVESIRATELDVRIEKLFIQAIKEEIASLKQNKMYSNEEISSLSPEVLATVEQRAILSVSSQCLQSESSMVYWPRSISCRFQNILLESISALFDIKEGLGGLDDQQKKDLYNSLNQKSDSSEDSKTKLDSETKEVRNQIVAFQDTLNRRVMAHFCVYEKGLPAFMMLF